MFTPSQTGGTGLTCHQRFIFTRWLFVRARVIFQRTAATSNWSKGLRCVAMEVVFGSDPRHAHMELAELPLREVRVDPPAHWHSQRRATLADLRKELQRGEVRVRPRYDHLAILSVYTLIRIFANLRAIDGIDFYATHFLSAVARPVITGLGVYIFISPRSRYSPKLRLHVLSWRVILGLSAFLFDESVVTFFFVVTSIHPTIIIYLALVSFIFWVLTCNVLQVYMTTLKIRALGWHRAARQML